MASGRFTVGLLGGAGVQAELPGQAPLGRQAVTDLEFAVFDGVGDGIDQGQVAGLLIIHKRWDPHEIATHAI
ncbi:hypothetical protein D3C76_1848800 [compost metagenome]